MTPRSKAGRDVVIWGSGTPRREFLHVDDLADACVFLMQHYDDARAHQRRHRRGPVDSRAGPAVAEIVHPDARLVFDPDKPDGTPRKLLDVEPPARPGLAAHDRAPRGIAATYGGSSPRPTPSRPARSTHDVAQGFRPASASPMVRRVRP